MNEYRNDKMVKIYESWQSGLLGGMDYAELQEKLLDMVANHPQSIHSLMQAIDLSTASISNTVRAEFVLIVNELSVRSMIQLEKAKPYETFSVFDGIVRGPRGFPINEGGIEQDHEDQ